MAELMLVNPAKRRKKRKAHAAPETAHKKTARRRRRNPVRVAKKHHARRRRRNPAGGSGFGAQFKVAMIGAGGGLIVDYAVGMVQNKLPPSMQTGNTLKAVKVGMAFALGMLAKKAGMLKGATANEMVKGALTVELYDLGRTIVQTNMPSLRLAGADDPLGMYLPAGEYVPTSGATSDKLLSGADDPAFIAGIYDSIEGVDDFGGIESDFAGDDYLSGDDIGYATMPNAYDI